MRAPIDRISRLVLIAAVALAPSLAAGAASAATITIVNMDGAGEGLNDPTPAAPVGGNPGTTVGAQRLFVYNHAAGIWGGILSSNVEIRAQAAFNPLSCTATSGTLGSAGPIQVSRDFPTAPLAGHWYHMALASKLAGTDQSPTQNDINSQFNSNIGQAGCLESTSWYYGVDGNPGTGIDFLAVVLHELGHGLGFSTTTSGQTGNYNGGFPHVYDHFLLDNSNGLHWDEMSAAQRVASATACSRLVWDGAYVTQKAPEVLNDKPLLRINSPATIDGDYEVGLPVFGTPLGGTGVTQDVVLVNDDVGTITNGCETLVNAAAVNGKIALMDRGGCAFTVKVKNAQNAGAIAAIVADSVPGCPPAGMGGVDPTITIPSVRLTLADGATIKANLGLGVNATMLRDPVFMAGADALGRVKAYTPSTFAGGSSISHWDTTTDPDLLMEPFNTPLPAGEVDLTKWHFADIGWFREAVAVGTPASVATRLLGNAPNPFGRSTAIHLVLGDKGKVELEVYDLGGRRVAALHRGPMAAGSHSIEWNGVDDSGRRAAPGVYVYRLRTKDTTQSGRMVMWQ